MAGRGAGIRIAALAVVFAVGAVYGALVHRNQLFPYSLLRQLSGRAAESRIPEDAPPGRWRRAVEEDRPATWEELSALGYLGTGAAAEGERSGIVVYARERVMPGLNLYSSGHAPEALLVDLEGRLRHRWRYDFRDAFPETEIEAEDFRADFWRKVFLLPEGGLLAIFEGLGLVRLDRRSRLVWAVANASHHDLDVAEDRIFVLTRTPRIDPTLDERHPILEDFVSVLDGDDGSELGRCSLLEAVRGSRYSALMDFVDGAGDLFHTNTLELLPEPRVERLAAAAGRPRALVSFPKLNTVAIVDLDDCRLDWALTGSFRFQHDPRRLANGNLLIFDNLHQSERSRVLEIDPESQEIVWTYSGGSRQSFFSRCCGTAQRLPNGNTLITESEAGRALEVDADGAVVWELWTPHRGGDDDELVATLNEVERVPFEAVAGWLPEASSGGEPSEPR